MVFAGFEESDFEKLILLHSPALLSLLYTSLLDFDHARLIVSVSGHHHL